jgi:hypothetical protein
VSGTAFFCGRQTGGVEAAMAVEALIQALRRTKRILMLMQEADKAAK